MIVTDTNLKALAACEGSRSMLAAEQDDAKPTLLLDECVTRRVSIGEISGVSYVHSVKEPGLGWGAKDEKMREIAKSRGYMIVTRDYEHLCACLDENINAALSYKGYAIVVRLEDKIALGAEVENNHVPILSSLGYYDYSIARRARQATEKIKKRSRLFLCKLAKNVRQRITKSIALKIIDNNCPLCGCLCKDKLRVKRHLRRIHKMPGKIAS